MSANVQSLTAISEFRSALCTFMVEARQALEHMASDEKKFVLLERSNHHIFWDYDREQVYAEVLRFLERHAAK